jgi:two-component sensor histidine kinase
MALVHDQLCRSDSVGNIDMQEYFISLLDKLFDMYGIDLRRIRSKVAAEGLFLRIETATPIGLIVTELVTNSLKYAFPHDEEGLVEVFFAPGEEGSYDLTVRDTGSGFSTEDAPVSMSVGLQLVDVLADQLRGSVRFETDHGTRVTITLPEKIVAPGR